MDRKVCRNAFRRCAATLLVATFVVAAVPLEISEAQAQTLADLRDVERAYDRAIHDDEPTRRFVELYLRVAGGIWIAVEWVAAVVLFLGYRRLVRWFADSEASP